MMRRLFSLEKYRKKKVVHTFSSRGLNLASTKVDTERDSVKRS